jgi:hypothetical protein
MAPFAKLNWFELSYWDHIQVFVAYGTTENSPITFMTTADSTFKVGSDYSVLQTSLSL